MTFDEALKSLSREERFMATVSAMNALLLAKGLYSAGEWEAAFCRWAEAETGKRTSVAYVNDRLAPGPTCPFCGAILTRQDSSRYRCLSCEAECVMPTVEQESAPPADSICPRCEGTGIYNFKACSICEGTGKFGCQCHCHAVFNYCDKNPPCCDEQNPLAKPAVAAVQPPVSGAREWLDAKLTAGDFEWPPQDANAIVALMEAYAASASLPAAPTKEE